MLLYGDICPAKEFRCLMRSSSLFVSAPYVLSLEFRAISACIAHNVVEFVLLGFVVVAMVPLKAECTQRGLNP